VYQSVYLCIPVNSSFLEDLLEHQRRWEERGTCGLIGDSQSYNFVHIWGLWCLSSCVYEFCRVFQREG
jgi:hypothetical protein